MKCVIMLSVVIPNAVILNVAAPLFDRTVVNLAVFLLPFQSNLEPTLQNFFYSSMTLWSNTLECLSPTSLFRLIFLTKRYPA
jgi:hypothetical protein